MKKLLLLVTLCAGASLSLGCGGAPSVSNQQEADQSMDATMGEAAAAADDPAAVDAAATPATGEGGATP